MLDKLLREIVVMTVGKGAEPIAELLNSRKHVNEFTIAKKLGITINQTRNILYKISDFGLVSSERKKDKKKGWYTYYWRFEILKCLEFLKENLLKRREQFFNQIKRRQEKQFYVCEYCNVEYSEDEALLMDFTCDECGELFTVKDNSTLLKGLQRNLDKIDENLAGIEVEIEKERKRLDKKKQNSLKKELEEIAAKKEEAKRKREEKRKERALLKKKEEKDKGKTTKKETIKKTSKKTTKNKDEKKAASKVKKTDSKKKPSKKVVKKAPKEIKKTSTKKSSKKKK